MKHITFRKGIKFFNESRFHDAHQAWECHWLHMEDSPEKRFLQGMIKVAGALDTYDKRNYVGTGKLLESGSTLLRENTSAETGIDSKAFLKHVDRIRNTFIKSRLIDEKDYPQIEVG